jgi:hypothetical protein
VTDPPLRIYDTSEDCTSKEMKTLEASNSQSESGPSRARGHVEADLSLRKYDTLEDGKNFALKRPEARTPEVIADR